MNKTIEYTKEESDTDWVAVDAPAPDCSEHKVIRLRVFECVSEEPGKPEAGEWYEGTFGSIMPSFVDPGCRVKIFKEVTE